ncbi:unnamed protein product [Caenorhabditis angaria]|uniref:Uncharacterized protein n=1 Tax=Caenorhabditis angaria TaxID=860376 RepID=A0A9P1MVR2_9PELO|nr:unnamed protein product [Caenorhabditis angaria]
MLQISRCTLSTDTNNRPRRILSSTTTSKSSSSLKKVQISRPRPYPFQGVRVKLAANDNHYSLRSKKESNILPGSTLPPNTDAFLGNKRRK